MAILLGIHQSWATQLDRFKSPMSINSGDALKISKVQQDFQVGDTTLGDLGRWWSLLRKLKNWVVPSSSQLMVKPMGIEKHWHGLRLAEATVKSTVENDDLYHQNGVWPTKLAYFFFGRTVNHDESLVRWRPKQQNWGSGLANPCRYQATKMRIGRNKTPMLPSGEDSPHFDDIGEVVDEFNDFLAQNDYPPILGCLNTTTLTQIGCLFATS